MSAKKEIEKLLAQAGVTLNGPNDFDVQVHNEKLYSRVLRGGSMALGESYMEGWWDAKSVDQFIYKILSSRLSDKFIFSWPMIMSVARAYFFNLETPAKSFKVGEQHYDIGNDIYEAMLGQRMVYTCGYWKNAGNLDQAQEAKLDLVCKKIGLDGNPTSPSGFAGQNLRILDIGCGWGGFLKFAAQKYGAKGTGVTISKNQVALAEKLCEGLPIEILLEDYRNVKGQFNHLVSLGMFEHVGIKNYRTYFKKAHELLKDDGLFLLHTIGTNTSTISIDPWIEKYIFPNSMLPSIAQIAKAVEGLFVIEDIHNFGADYDKTLMAWFENFDKAWPQLKGKYGDKFYRMWKYYLLLCAASFRSRGTQLWQIMLSKKGVPGGYKSIR